METGFCRIKELLCSATTLAGRQFILYTDHKPLTFALKKAADPWTARQQRQLAFLAEFKSDIRHVAGGDIVVADTLSRPGTGEGEAGAGLTRSATCPGLHYFNRPGQQEPASTIFRVAAKVAVGLSSLHTAVVETPLVRGGGDWAACGLGDTG
jgi:hypothetical protein